MGELVEEVKAQAVALALRCAPGLSNQVSITTVADPRMPSRVTIILAELGAGPNGELVLVDLDAEHVMEHAHQLDAVPGVLVEGVRLAARLIYIGPHLVGPLREALAQVG